MTHPGAPGVFPGAEPAVSTAAMETAGEPQDLTAEHRTSYGLGLLPRRWRRRRLALLLVLLVAAVAASAFYYFTHPQRLAELAATQLAALTGAEVSVGAAHFQVSGPLVLYDVALRAPGGNGTGALVAEFGRVHVHHDHGQLLQRRFRPFLIELLGEPVLYITEDLDRDRFNIDWLFHKAPREPAAEPPQLPTVRFDRLALVPGEVRGGRYQARRPIRLIGELRPNGSDVEAGFIVDVRTEADADAVTLTGHLPIGRGTANLDLHRVGLDSPLMDALPDQWRRWLIDRRPGGRIERINVLAEPSREVRAEIDLAGTRLLPPGCSEPLFLTVKRGRFIMEGNRVRTDLGGELGGFDYHITGQVTNAFSRRPTIDLHLAAQGRIEPDPPWLAWITDGQVHTAIRRELEEFQPEGPVEIAARLTQGPDDPHLRYDAQIRLNGLRARFRDFPYPVRDLRGHMRVRDGRLTIDRVEGIGPSGAVITVQAWVDDIGPSAGPYAGEVRVWSEAIPLDEHLLAAMRPEDHQAVAMFFDSAAHRRLEQAGLIRSAAQSEPGAGEAPPAASHQAPAEADLEPADGSAESGGAPAPAFDLGGHAAFEAIVRRDPHQRRLWHPTISIRPAGLRFIYQDWPYPGVVEGGAIRIQRRQVTVEAVNARLLGGGALVIDGSVGPRHPDPQSPSIPDLAVRLSGLEVDDMLLATLPPEDASWLETLHIEGRIDAEAAIGAAGDAQTDYRIDARLRRGRAWPNRDSGGAYPLEALEADLRIEPQRVLVSDLHARHGPTRFSGEAGILGRGEGRDLRLELRAQGLRFEDPVLDLTPVGRDEVATVSGLLEDHALTGSGDARVSLHAVGDGEPRYRVAIEPHTVGLEVDGRRIALEGGAGTVVVDGTTALLEGVRFRHAGGEVAADGQVSLTGPAQFDLRFGARGESIDDSVRAVLPEGVRTVFDELELSTGYDLREARLRRAVDEDGQATLGFSATVDVEDASMRIGFPLKEMDATIRIGLNHPPDAPWPRLDVHVDARRLRYHDRLIRPLTARLVSEDGGEMLHIRDLHGSVYDGAITGHGRLFREQDAMRYELELALQEVALQPFLDPETEPRWDAGRRRAARQAGEQQDMIFDADQTTARQLGRGVASASLTLAGVVGDDAARRGRGLVRVRDARLFEFPLAMAVAQLINLNLPASSAFHSATFDYLVDGDTVHFEDVRFLARSLEMRGQGTLELTSQRLSLLFHSRNPNGNDQIGPFPDLFRMLKAELFSIRVSGTIEQPEARLQTLTATSKTIQELFGTPSSRD